MLYFKTTDGTIKGDVVAIGEHVHDDNTVSRWDFKTFDIAEQMAAKCNALKDGETYIATDAGSGCSPRYDVQRVPKVGEAVSKGFNGDYYPCGKIVSVGTGSKMIIKTDTGAVFYRRRTSGGWLMQGGTWWLVLGTHNDKNREF